MTVDFYSLQQCNMTISGIIDSRSLPVNQILYIDNKLVFSSAFSFPRAVRIPVFFIYLFFSWSLYVSAIRCHVYTHTHKPLQLFFLLLSFHLNAIINSDDDAGTKG